MGKVGITDTNQYSLLQQEYPRIADKLFVYWGSREFSPYLNELLFTNRVDIRKGFPVKVLTALDDLRAIHDENWPQYRLDGSGSIWK